MGHLILTYSALETPPFSGVAKSSAAKLKNHRWSKNALAGISLIPFR
jgi:hypothetical protein